jgi:hypothetical protein
MKEHILKVFASLDAKTRIIKAKCFLIAFCGASLNNDKKITNHLRLVK